MQRYGFCLNKKPKFIIYVTFVTPCSKYRVTAWSNPCAPGTPHSIRGMLSNSRTLNFLD